MSIPKEAFEPASHYYGLYGFGCSPVKPVFSAGANPAPKPADAISISLEFLRGVDAAHEWAADNYDIYTIFDAVISAEVARLHEEATK